MQWRTDETTSPSRSILKGVAMEEIVRLLVVFLGSNSHRNLTAVSTDMNLYTVVALKLHKLVIVTLFPHK